MGRRNRNKSRASVIGDDNAYLTKKKFKKRFCKQCGICGKNTSARFCYTTLYSYDRIVFSRIVFPNMVRHKEQLKRLADGQLPPDFTDLRLIRTVFCSAELCPNCFGTTHKELTPCFNAFITQVKRSTKREKLKNAALNLLTSDIKPEPRMLVMIPNDIAFETEVLKILEGYTPK